MRNHHFGVLIPATNTTCEIEYSRLLPPNLQVHVGRLGKGGDSPFSPSLDADLSYQSKMLGHAKVEVVALAQTSASLFDDGIIDPRDTRKLLVFLLQTIREAAQRDLKSNTYGVARF